MMDYLKPLETGRVSFLQVSVKLPDFFIIEIEKNGKKYIKPSPSAH